MSTATTARGLGALRLANRERLLAALREHGDVSRAELARLTALSGTTVSSLVTELADAGLVVEGGDDRTSGRRGRPGRLVRAVRDRRLVVAMDLSLDVVRAAVCDADGAVLAEVGEAPALAGPDDDGSAALAHAAGLVERLLAADGVDRRRVEQLVAAVPGVVDPTNGAVVSDRRPRWRELDLGQELERATGLPTRLENDADLCALGERAFGAARGLDDVVLVKASTGIGVGLVLAGRLYRGAHGGVGELGHVQVSEPGDLCVCGNRGCLETVAASGPVIAALQVVHPHVRTHEDVAALVAAGDRGAVRAVTDAGTAIGKTVADLCNVLAPQAVVVGGDLAAGGDHLTRAVRDAVERSTKPRTAGRLALLTGELGHRAALLGAVVAADAAHAPS
ncbi:ROK family transcriptional regulator [Pseudokineococcus marinus]|uniref:ROK family transcriptional regulator n=1 Tax=Pseudokineococcus marinus TaxID=351215 RepID=A0A849BMQ2_9ACTN|nr:ROK family transcriptional regulator [Pseudokineococcus marinus]NNH22072.1 ROK family transcriptional regulator [Pseudokineococcus marinus]